MLKFACLGSGSSGNSYILFTPTFGILIDAGIGIRTLKKHFQTLNLTFKQINAILITHDHADHIKSVGTLSNQYNLPVYATQKVHQGINKSYSVHPKPDPQHTRIIQKDKTITLGEFQITPFDVPHDSTDNVGYLITHRQTTFCLITDAGQPTQQFPTYIAQTNYLVIESNHDEDMVVHGPYPTYLKQRILGLAGHMSNTTAAKLIADNITPKLRHIWLCHLSEENNHPELARKTTEQALKNTGRTPGVDIQLDILKRHTPTNIYTLD